MRSVPSPAASPRKTVADLLALPDGVRAELVEGEITLVPAPSVRHQSVVRPIFLALDRWATETAAGFVFFAPLDVGALFDEARI
jgi:hypothetical protein